LETVLLTLLTAGFLPAVAGVWWYFRSQHKAEIERLEKSGKDSVEDLKSSHAQAISDLRDTHQREISMMTEAHRREIDTLTRFHSERVEVFNARIDELRDALRERDEKLTMLDDTMKEYTQAMTRVSEILLTQAEVSNRQVIEARSESSRRLTNEQ
jgi:prefoldin subunit 5